MPKRSFAERPDGDSCKKTPRMVCQPFGALYVFSHFIHTFSLGLKLNKFQVEILFHPKTAGNFINQLTNSHYQLNSEESLFFQPATLFFH